MTSHFQYLQKLLIYPFFNNDWTQDGYTEFLGKLLVKNFPPLGKDDSQSGLTPISQVTNELILPWVGVSLSLSLVKNRVEVD